MKKTYLQCLLWFSFIAPLSVMALPKDFVYLSDIDQSIVQDIRYAGDHNFVGRPIAGYQKPVCILTKRAALALTKVQKELLKSGLSLKVYDCYRPQMAVSDFVTWSKLPAEQDSKDEFYPNIDKKKLFRLGFVDRKSAHSRGCTVDLTIVQLPLKIEPTFHRGQPLVACNASFNERYADNSIDMGTGFDCMDKSSYTYTRRVGFIAFHHRAILRSLMQKYGFSPYEKEWWHFSLRHEPHPREYFNFPVA